MNKILILNTGSSSLKYRLFEIEGTKLQEIKRGGIDSIGAVGGPKNYQVALTLLFEGFGVGRGNLEKIDNLVAIGHRVVHGGNKYFQPIKINHEVIKQLKNYSSLAPLHNPPIIEVIRAVYKNSISKNHREIPNYAVFDTEFYSKLPLKTKLYPLPYEFYEKYEIQRFGFHGISHENGYNQVMLKIPNAKKIITLHLGAGSSITAIKNGEAIDTSMGFTPLEGLMMSTRSGDIDPGIITFLQINKKMSVKKIYDLINNKSGLLGISEISSQMEDILFLSGYKVEDELYQPTNIISNATDFQKQRAKLALEMYCYRIQKYIGAYIAILNGLDVLVFTGEIGYGSKIIRNLVLDPILNILGDAKIFTVPTDEELSIAKKILPLIHYF